MASLRPKFATGTKVLAWVFVACLLYFGTVDVADARDRYVESLDELYWASSALLLWVLGTLTATAVGVSWLLAPAPRRQNIHQWVLTATTVLVCSGVAINFIASFRSTTACDTAYSLCR